MDDRNTINIEKDDDSMLNVVVEETAAEFACGMEEGEENE